MAIRRSARGEAADILRRQGTKALVGDILKNCQSTYGQIDNPETILKNFYACQMEPNETFTKYAARVEELFAQAVDIDVLKPSNIKLLKTIVYQGKSQPLKQNANLKYETTPDYDKFKTEVQKIESEMKSAAAAAKTKDFTHSAKCNAVNENKSELGELKSLLTNMNNRLELLEKEKETQHQQTQLLLQQQTEMLQQHMQQPFFQPRGFDPNRGQWQGRGRGNRVGRTSQPFRGRGQLRHQRPLSATTFRPYRPASNNTNSFTCYNCGKEGHIARRCPEN